MKSFFRTLKTRSKSVIGKDLVLTFDINCKKEKIGSDYGGWDVVVANIHADSLRWQIPR